MAQWLRALAALAEDLGSILSTQLEAQRPTVTPVSGNVIFILRGHQAGK